MQTNKKSIKQTKQTNTTANKQANKQTHARRQNKHPNKQTSKQKTDRTKKEITSTDGNKDTHPNETTTLTNE